MWFLKSFLFNILKVVIFLGPIAAVVALFIWLCNIGLHGVALIILAVISIAIYTLMQGPSIDDIHYDEDGHIQMR